jgi:hypothetical protein
MRINKIKKYNLYQIYNIAVLSARTAVTESMSNNILLLEQLQLVETSLFPIVEYMLHGKSRPAKKKKIKKSKISLKGYSTDMLIYMGVITDKKSEAVKKNSSLIDHNDIIKLFKVFEQFILRKKFIINLEELKLGKFAENAVIIHSNLPKLLVSALNLDIKSKELLYNYVFSIFRIYRQFKTTAQPDPKTIISPYSGDPFALIEADDFSEEKINFWTSGIIKDFSKDDLQILLYSGNASSPNSSSSASKMIDDLDAVRKDKDLYTALESLAKNFNGSKDLFLLLEHLNDDIYKTQVQAVDKKTIHSRLFTFTAPGGKSRIIANVD